MKKTLALYPFNQKFPVVYDSTIEFFSKNYDLRYSPPKRAYFYWLKDNHLIRNFYYLIMKIFRKFLELTKLKKKPKVSTEKSLLFCFNQLPPPEFDFILDLEIVLGLVSYDYSKLDEKCKKYISDRLTSEKCKAINCWNEYVYSGLIELIDCSRFKNKINVIPFAGKNINLKKKNKKNFNFLFVASVNNPISFKTKGGLIALDAFAELTKKYENIKFFVRANIGNDLIKKYKNVPGLIFLRKYLSDEKMDELFAHSDVLLEPLPGMDLIIKCTEFEVPVISFDYEYGEGIIIDMGTGFLIDKDKIFGSRKNLTKYLKNLIVNSGDPKFFSEKEGYHQFVPEFAEKAEILIKDRKLLDKMKKMQHSLVGDMGKYSLKKRNQKLKKLIDPHMEIHKDDDL